MWYKQAEEKNSTPALGFPRLPYQEWRGRQEDYEYMAQTSHPGQPSSAGAPSL